MKRLKEIYEKYWIDVGAALLILLLLGGGLLLIKKGGVEKGTIEIIEPKGVETAIEENVKGATEELEVEEESGLININTAGQKELESLPGIGEKTAEKIIDYRDENGDFGSVEEIMEVKGIGEGKFEDLEGLISVE